MSCQGRRIGLGISEFAVSMVRDIHLLLHRIWGISGSIACQRESVLRGIPVCPCLLQEIGFIVENSDYEYET